MIDSNELVNSVVAGVQDVKGKSITIIDLKETDNSICSYFVICSGDSSTQVNAIANSVERGVKTELKERPIAKDGFANAQWVALDYGDVLVHIFQRETREFYNLEGLWADGNVTEIDDLD